MRTRAHIIEDESRLEFRRILPKEWVCRDKNLDYGIDLEVEIFDNNGKPTGRVFWVQLKATDSANQKVIRNITLTRSKLIQYRSYDLSILIVRYSVIEKASYTKWAKSIDLSLFNPERKYIKISFLNSDIWNEKTDSEINQYLTKVTKIKKGYLHLPIKSIIEIDTECTSIPIRIVMSNLRRELLSQSSLVEEVTDPDESICRISISNETKIDFYDQSVSFIRVKKNDDLDFNYFDLKTGILIGLSLCLSKLGQIEISNTIIFKASLFKSLYKNKDILLTLLPSLLHGIYFKDSITEIIKTLENEENNEFVQLTINVILLFHQNEHERENFPLIEDFLKAQIAKSINSQNDRSIGVSYYNLANHYRSRSLFEMAFHNYVLAKRFYNYYKKHHYFYREIAGVLYELGKFHFAGNAYKKALDLGSPVFNTKALYADSLMFDGKYRTALDVFNSYLEETKEKADNNDEWYLKYTCLESLLESGYKSDQKRNPIKANELITITDSDDLEIIKNQCENALESDMLCSLAWFNLGVLHYTKKQQFSALISYLFSALIAVRDVTAWVNAFSCSLNKESPSIIMYHIVRVAYYYNNERFIQALHEGMKGLSNEQMKDILSMIDMCISKKYFEERTIRLLGEDTFETITI